MQSEKTARRLFGDVLAEVERRGMKRCKQAASSEGGLQLGDEEGRRIRDTVEGDVSYVMLRMAVEKTKALRAITLNEVVCV